MMTPASGGHDLAQDLLETLALGVGQLAADAGGRCRRARTRGSDRPGEICVVRRAPLWPTGSLLTWTSTWSPGLERLLDLAAVAAEPGGLPVDLTGVQHAVAAAADVDERRLHAGQHVLDAAEVDVADHRRGRRRGDEVLDEDAVLEHRDLGQARAGARRRSSRAPPSPGRRPRGGPGTPTRSGSADDGGRRRGRRGDADASPRAGSSR